MMTNGSEEKQNPIDMSAKRAGGQHSYSASHSKKMPWKKPPGFPKRPLSAYNIFVREERQKMKDSGDVNLPQLPPGSVIVKGSNPVIEYIATKWRALSPTSRKPYQELADKEKDEYTKAVTFYRSEQTKKSAQEETSKEVSMSMGKGGDERTIFSDVASVPVPGPTPLSMFFAGNYQYSASNTDLFPTLTTYSTGSNNNFPQNFLQDDPQPYVYQPQYPLPVPPGSFSPSSYHYSNTAPAFFQTALERQSPTMSRTAISPPQSSTIPSSAMLPDDYPLHTPPARRHSITTLQSRPNDKIHSNETNIRLLREQLGPESVNFLIETFQDNDYPMSREFTDSDDRRGNENPF